ncbi:MAG TPA: oligopeptide/dipeptide ABC transporter ATP-binding protein [Propionibacteriaceae bacterium]|nr:oligopeptide/dipeptide ABC transporter ATP-binding protein [Propionibacteriaceae bacterium]
MSEQADAVRDAEGSTPTLYSVRDLHMHFPVLGGVLRRKVGEVKAVDGVSLDIRQGETLGILGESGCGKSTLGRVLTLLEKPTSGALEYTFADDSAPTRVDQLDRGRLFRFRREVQMIFQDPYSAFDPRQRVGDAFEELLVVHGVRSRSARQDRVEQALGMVNMRPDALAKLPHEFSGGQRQRLCIARCLTISPRLVIADEIVSALDVSIQAQVINILRRIQDELGTTFAFISHDVSVVQYMSDRVAIMYLGEVMEVLDSDGMHDLARHPYTQALLSAVPTMDEETRRARIVLAGDVPSPINKPEGCPFSTRCPYVMERCRVEKPLLRVPDPDRPSHVIACHLDPAPTIGERTARTAPADEVMS